MPDIEGVPYEASGGKLDQATAQALAARHREAATAGVGAASAAGASALSSAKAYTDSKVTGLATTAAMQAGDALTLSNAKTYADGKVANLDPLPAGGTTGQVLTKTSSGSAWQNSPTGLPSGGSTGQVLTKTSDGSAWADPKGEKGEKGEKGDKGDTGPATTLTIGTVTDGATAGATLTGEAPAQTLSLVLPKGATGDRGPQGVQGPPGVVSSASAYVIVGPGRPDTPATTGGVVTGSEPVGAEYRSTDGAGVGAWTWRKRPTGWVVTDGDTGWRKITRTDSWTDSNAYYLVRRTSAGVTFITSVKNVTGSVVNWPDVWAWSLAEFAGFRPNPRGVERGVGLTMRVGNSVATINSDGTRWTTPQHAPAGQQLAVHVFVQSDNPWPTAPLPGSPD